jgi:restriction system protein
MLCVPSKLKRLKSLGSLRQRHCYRGYHQISDFHHGNYESDFVSPYTKTAGNVNSDIAILLQDWASEENLSGPFDREAALLGYTPAVPTNKNLVKLLHDVFELELSDIFATNVFPYIKPGEMSAPIPQCDFDRAFAEFCFPQINIVKPRFVICCGKKVFLSCWKFFNEPEANPLTVGSYFENSGIRFHYQRHPSPQAINRNGGINQAITDWNQMRMSWNIFLQ